MRNPRHRAILFSAAALVVLVAALWLGRDRPPTVPPATPAGSKTATSSGPDPGTAAVSPDALAPAEQGSSDPAALPVYVSAAAAMDLSSGELLYQFQPDLRRPIASLTKIMTAVVAEEYMDPAGSITLVPADFTVGGSNLTASLQPGERYSFGDMLRILLVPSSNEAAEAFARTYGSERFLATMNSQAAFWGLRSTYFADPSGLSAANQSTAREFLELTRRAYARHPEIFAITRAPGMAVRELNSGAGKYFSTTNNFAGRADFLGGKTGTTPTAGGNLVSVFSVNGRTVATVVFGAEDRYAATASLLQLIR